MAFAGAQDADDELTSDVEAHAQYVTNTLLRALARVSCWKLVACTPPLLLTGSHAQVEGPDAVKCALAAELLGKGFSIWKNYIVDLVGECPALCLFCVPWSHVWLDVCRCDSPSAPAVDDQAADHCLGRSPRSARGPWPLDCCVSTSRSVTPSLSPQAGRVVPKYFVQCMGKEVSGACPAAAALDSNSSCSCSQALNSKSNARGRSGALIAIVALVRRYPEALAYVRTHIHRPCLPASTCSRLVLFGVRFCPTRSRSSRAVWTPRIRRSASSSCSLPPLVRTDSVPFIITAFSLHFLLVTALHSLVQKYPMVSFHQESQRFAVGTGVSHKSVCSRACCPVTHWLTAFRCSGHHHLRFTHGDQVAHSGGPHGDADRDLVQPQGQRAGVVFRRREPAHHPRVEHGHRGLLLQPPRHSRQMHTRVQSQPDQGAPLSIPLRSCFLACH